MDSSKTLLENLQDLFSFFVDGLTEIATFFTTNAIGQIVLGVALFAFGLSLFFRIVNGIRGH